MENFDDGLTPKEETSEERTARYETKLDALILNMTQNPDSYPTEKHIVIELEPFHPSNERVFKAATTILKMTAKNLYMAMEKLVKDQNAYAAECDKIRAEQEQEQKIIDALGAVPTNEREYVALLLNKKYVFKRGAFTENGIDIKANDVSDDLILTAADLDFTHPRGKVLSDTKIEIAFNAWMSIARQKIKGQVWAAISALTDGRKRETVLDAFKTICEIYFTEPDFAMAACLKGIWQVKRKMCGLSIVHHHMLVIQSREQGSGKTTFMRMMLHPVYDVFQETDVLQVLDDKNFDCRESYAIFTDELAKAERADVNKLKNVISGQDVSTRLHYRHGAATVKINMTLFGTTNPELATIIYDITGMRRFVEISPHRTKEIEPRWQEIVDFDWLGLWQAVDETSEDPIMSTFADELAAKQETMRAKNNVEAWLEQFEPSSAKDTKSYEKGSYAEYYASDLYNIFSDYEQQYHRASHGTSLTTWGTEMKALIKADKLASWTWRYVGHRTAYRIDMSNVVQLYDTMDDDAAMISSKLKAARKNNLD